MLFDYKEQNVLKGKIFFFLKTFLPAHSNSEALWSQGGRNTTCSISLSVSPQIYA